MKSNPVPHVRSRRSRRLPRLLSLSALALASVAAATAPGHAAGPLSDHAKAQMAEILAVKKTFSPEEKKMSANLALARRKALGLDIGETAQALTPSLGASSFVKVEIHGRVTESLAGALHAMGAQVTRTDAATRRITAHVTLDSLGELAKHPDVTAIRLPMPRHPNVGGMTGQGYISLSAREVIKTMGYTGAGVKVGVMSDSASVERVAALMKSGDLGAGTKVFRHGPTIDEGGTDEGTAMMEVVQDIAPGADVYFSSVYDADFNYDISGAILQLQNNGCKVLVDDFGGPEGVFQDDLDAQTINKVTTVNGVIYCSSAGNSNNFAHGTSGTWEGDFLAGDTVSGIGNYTLHNFRPNFPQSYDPATVTGEPYQYLTWADPLGTSTNDYDFFVTDAAGDKIKGFSIETQDADGASTGDSYPEEILEISAYGGNYDDQEPGDRFIIAKTPDAAPLALHMDTERGSLEVGTTGATYGHNAAANTVCVAASYWNSAFTGAKPLTGRANPVETFSSDGPRKIFFQPDGTPITPGNFLFATKGGQTLAKPTTTAVDGAEVETPGFFPFFGTSEAAPHAAGVAALVISARSAAGMSPLSPKQLRTVLGQLGTINNEAKVTSTDPTGKFDAAGGYGVLNAPTAVKAALALP